MVVCDLSSHYSPKATLVDFKVDDHSQGFSKITQGAQKAGWSQILNPMGISQHHPLCLASLSNLFSYLALYLTEHSLGQKLVHLPDKTSWEAGAHSWVFILLLG